MFDAFISPLLIIFSHVAGEEKCKIPSFSIVSFILLEFRTPVYLLLFINVPLIKSYAIPPTNLPYMLVFNSLLSSLSNPDICAIPFAICSFICNIL